MCHTAVAGAARRLAARRLASRRPVPLLQLRLQLHEQQPCWHGARASAAAAERRWLTPRASISSSAASSSSSSSSSSSCPFSSSATAFSYSSSAFPSFPSRDASAHEALLEEAEAEAALPLTPEDVAMAARRDTADVLRIFKVVRAFRSRGHFAARLDPLGRSLG
jgi:hypothetical protein